MLSPHLTTHLMSSRQPDAAIIEATGQRRCTSWASRST